MDQLSEKERENALNEVRILASIDHPNIISYKEAFIDEESASLWIVMEYADAGDAFQLMCNLRDGNKWFTEEEIWRIFIQTARGLQQLHDMEIMHRDLKSANIFLFSDGLVKLGDLNVSKVMKNTMEYTQTGTPYYASPEVWKDEIYNYKSDIWSLGWVIYELIWQKPPFDAESMDQLYHTIIKGKFEPIPMTYSTGLERVISSLIKVSPGKRPTWKLILNEQTVSKWSSKILDPSKILK
jgi:NIMA (never in mitosis gene a)-related kinase